MVPPRHHELRLIGPVANDVLDFVGTRFQAIARGWFGLLAGLPQNL